MSTVLPSSAEPSATSSSVAANSPAPLSLRERMTRDLQLRGLSPRTQEAYLRAVRQLAAFYRLPPDQLNEEQLRDYFLYLKNQKHFAANSLKIAYCGPGAPGLLLHPYPETRLEDTRTAARRATAAAP